MATMLSRVGDSLYWMSRYLERAEHTARLIDVNLNNMLDDSPEDAGRWKRLLRSLRTTPNVQQPGGDDLYETVRFAAFDRDNPDSMMNCLASARENARQVRDSVSTEMWEQLNRLYLQVRGTGIEQVWGGDLSTFCRSIRDGAYLFQGVTDSTMNHDEGWQFIQVGRSIERASAVATLLQVFFADFEGEWDEPVVGHDYLEWIALLKSCTAFEAYCKVYSAEIHPNEVAEFLLLNPSFPHSVRACVDAIRTALFAIADITQTNKARKVNRLAGKLQAMLDYSAIDEIMDDGFEHYLENVQRQCSAIHVAMYETYVEYPIEKELQP